MLYRRRKKSPRHKQKLIVARKGYKYSKEDAKWIKSSTEQAIDYENIELYDEDSWGLLISYWRQYPDRLLDLLESENPPYTLEPIQLMLIRIYFRCEHVFVTGSRGLTKSVVPDATY